MQTIGIVLNAGKEHVGEFERGFRQPEVPLWKDLESRGVLRTATLSRLDISSSPHDGAIQYLVIAIFATEDGHHQHDNDPRFHAWNKEADAYQVAEPYVFGGDTIVTVGV